MFFGGRSRGPEHVHRVVTRDFARVLVTSEAVPSGQRSGLPILLHPERQGRPALTVTGTAIHQAVHRASFFRAQEQLLGPDAIAEAVWGLKSRQPACSAYQVVTREQTIAGLILLTVLAIWAVAAPVLFAAVMIVALSGLNAIIAAFRIGLAWIALEPSGSEVRGAPLTEWPLYTVLVPLYREAAVVPGLVQAIGGLDYPADRLEIFLVCEDDDAATISAARIAAEDDPRFRLILVPACEPRTKPKALNYALAFARGELLVIFDAEDRPDPDQLRKAAMAFAGGPAELSCLQARLNWYNKDRTWLTRLFALEYALWFDYMLPGLQRLGAPIPLGGTSNHFKTSALIACGAWDPFNVTEDADLGLRFMRLGGLVATLDSTTLEEATCTTRAWVRQRSRWIKGYMQTWLVQMRDPAKLWRSAGAKGFLGFQLFVGGVALTAIVNPVLWAATLISLVCMAAGLESPIPGAAPWWAAVSLVAGNFGLIYLNMLCALRRRWLELVPSALLTPVYWVLMSIAGYKALGQLITNPFYWEKTEHGVGISS